MSHRAIDHPPTLSPAGMRQFAVGCIESDLEHEVRVGRKQPAQLTIYTDLTPPSAADVRAAGLFRVDASILPDLSGWEPERDVLGRVMPD